MPHPVGATQAPEWWRNYLATKKPRLTERLARAMARRHHERTLEWQSLKGIAPPEHFERERFLERATDADWPDFFDAAVAVIEELVRWRGELRLARRAA
jgi:hypothetical protein